MKLWCLNLLCDLKAGAPALWGAAFQLNNDVLAVEITESGLANVGFQERA